MNALPRLPSRGLIEATFVHRRWRTLPDLFPGYPAGASLKRRGGLRQAVRFDDLFPGYPAGASLKHAKTVARRDGRGDLFPGYPAGASLKHHRRAGVLARARRLFPGYPAGASLKPVFAPLRQNGAPVVSSPVTQPGPH